MSATGRLAEGLPLMSRGWKPVIAEVTHEVGLSKI